jgi:hypothetical protein
MSKAAYPVVVIPMFSSSGTGSPVTRRFSRSSVCAISERARMNRRRPSINWHHQKVDAILAADIMQSADVRVVQRSNGASLALEAFA